MLSKYRMEKANPEMEKARLTSRLNAVQQRIKEVEELLDAARRNAEFESKNKDNPYWKIAKKRYIETGDPAAIENFRAKQDALEEAEKNRQIRNNELQEQKRQQYIYDELNARRDVQNAEVDYDVAYDSGDKVALEKAKNALKYAKEHYEQVTGKEYKLSPKYKLEDTESQNDPQNNPQDDPQEKADEGSKTDTDSWLSDAPLYADSGAKNAKDYAAYLMKFSDANDREGKNRIADEATKNYILNWLYAKKDRWADLGLDQTKVNSIKSHWSKEVKDASDAAKQTELLQLKKKWNDLVDKYQAAKNEDERNKLLEVMNATHVLLKKKGSKPEGLKTKFSI